MGIQNLLPSLSKISKNCSLHDFAGKKVAIDGFVWLHRAAISCAQELAYNPETESILFSLNRRMAQFQSTGAIPVVVFDGQYLPSKSLTNEKRHSQREANLLKAEQLMSSGDSKEAYQYYIQAIDIQPSTVYTWIKSLQQSNIEYYVAPYEADAQLAYFARTGYVSAVLTEDSDLIAYQCPLTLFKLNDNMEVISISFSDVLSYLDLTIFQFLAVCALSGCDYIEHIKGIGFQKALKIVKNSLQTPSSVISTIRIENKLYVPENYELQLERAIITFLHAPVYDIISNKLMFLEPFLSSDYIVPDYLGNDIGPDLLDGIIKGKLNPRTLQPYEAPQSTGKMSPYFSSFRPPKPSSSPYFQKYDSKKPLQKISSKISSYMQLLYVN